MQNIQAKEGFTLIELSIALIVVGLLIVPLLAAYKVEVQNRHIGFNTSQFAQIQNNINYFATQQGMYPVPASLLAAPGDADYGEEAAGVPADCTTWPTANGICSTGGANPILIGAVPFAALGINPDSGLDYWHNKILYAVTETQTTGYTAGDGRIIMQAFEKVPDGAGGWMIVLNPNFSADNDMVLVSLGSAGEGAYNENGLRIGDCTAATREQENCDFDNTFLMWEIPGQLGTGATSYLAGNTYYDDITDNQRSVPVDLWLQNVPDPLHAMTYADRIGIGTENPDELVHVMGDISGDNVLTDTICGAAAAGCFDPMIIAGAEPQMNCNNNSITGSQPVLRIGNEQVFCASPVDGAGNALDGLAYEFPVDFGRTNCADTAQLMIGLDVNGDPICATP